MDEKAAMKQTHIALLFAFGVALLASANPAWAQFSHPDVDQSKVEAAIQNGAKHILSCGFKDWDYREGKQTMRYDELALLTLLHAGTDPQHKKFQELLKRVLNNELKHVYPVALQAMFLSEFDAVRYQWRIAQCCQFLVDNQCKNGQWYYGTTTTMPKNVPTPPSEQKDVASGDKKVRAKTTPGYGQKPKFQIKIKRQRFAEETGDNSNAQYAALGLRACIEANVHPPKSTLRLARHWWRSSQKKDGGWSYYGKKDKSYGAMTIGAVGSLVIYNHYLGDKWKRDPQIALGIRWMAENFSVREHVKYPRPKQWFYYYLYAIERAGIFTEMETFGDHEWYPRGANHLLSLQNKDGSWGKPFEDTCFAILFLRRATIPIASGSTRK